MSVKLVFCLILAMMVCFGCSSGMVAEKGDSGIKRSRILEEDITDNVKVPGPEPAPAPATGTGAVNPAAIPGGVSLPSPDPSPKTPRRFQWKDSR